MPTWPLYDHEARPPSNPARTPWPTMIELTGNNIHTHRCEEKSDYYNHYVAHVLATGSSPRWQSLAAPHEL